MKTSFLHHYFIGLTYRWLMGKQARPTRWIKEAIHIHKERQRAMNREEGSYQLSHASTVFLAHLLITVLRTGWGSDCIRNSDDDFQWKSKRQDMKKFWLYLTVRDSLLWGDSFVSCFIYHSVRLTEWLQMLYCQHGSAVLDMLLFLLICHKILNFICKNMQ